MINIESGINVLSLFDGMSCGQIAFERCGIKVNNYLASEIKKHAIKLTQYNYPKTIQLGDVLKVRVNENGIYVDDVLISNVIPDVLIGGSPCQDLSLANKDRNGLNGLKSRLFYEYIRIYEEIKKVNPDIKYLLENVEMKDKDKQIISYLLGTYPVNINSQLVSAQMRNRNYWTNIGAERFDLFGFRYCDIPQPKNKHIYLKHIIENGFTGKKKVYVC